MRYYIDLAGRSFGPFSSDTVRDMIAAGKVTRSTKVSIDKREWKTAEVFQELFPSDAKPNTSWIADDVDDSPVWYVSVDGRTTYGPYKASEVSEALKNGRLSGDAYVWREGERARPLKTEPAFQDSSESNAGISGSATASSAAPNSSDPRIWYYSVDGKVGYGPFSVSEIRDLALSDRSVLDAVVWRQGENSRRLRTEPAFASLVNQTAGSLTTDYAATPYSSSGYVQQQTSSYGATYPSSGSSSFTAPIPSPISTLQAVELNTRLAGIWKIALYVSFVPLFFLVFSLLVEFAILFTDSGPVLSLVLDCLTFIAYFSFMIVWAFFVHALWRSIPPGYTGVSPVVAVVLFLIPIVSQFWLFGLICGGTNSINIALARLATKSGTNERPSYASPIMAGVLVFLCWFWGIGWTLTPLVPLMTLSLKRAAIQLNSWRAGDMGGPNSRAAFEQSNAPQSRVTLDEIVNS